VIFMNKNYNYYYFYHYQVFKIKYRNLNTTNVCVLFYVGPSHSIFLIHTTLDQSIITWCLFFQFIFQHHTNVPTDHEDLQQESRLNRNITNLVSFMVNFLLSKKKKNYVTP